MRPYFISADAIRRTGRPALPVNVEHEDRLGESRPVAQGWLAAAMQIETASSCAGPIGRLRGEAAT